MAVVAETGTFSSVHSIEILDGRVVNAEEYHLN